MNRITSLKERIMPLLGGVVLGVLLSLTTLSNVNMENSSKLIPAINLNVEEVKVEESAPLKIEEQKIVEVAPSPVVVEDPQPEPVKPIINGLYKVTASALNVRKEASMNGTILGVYHQNNIVEVIGQEGEWYKNADGFIHSDYITKHTGEKPSRLSKVSVSRGGTMGSYFTLNVSSKSGLSLDDIYRITEGTALKGIEEAVLEVEEKYGVNALFTIAVARLESGNGTTRIAQDKNNLFGLNALDSNPYKHAFSYDTKSESVYAFGRIIKDNYINRGLDTPGKINSVYCPASDSWSDKIIVLMREVHYKGNKR